MLGQEDIYYFLMYIKTSSSTWTKIITESHIVKGSTYDNYVIAVIDNLYLESGRDIYQLFEFSHNYLGSPNIYLRHDGQIKQWIGDQSIGQKELLIKKSGYHTVELILDYGSSSIILDNDSYWVAGEDDVPLTGFEGILSFITYPYNVFIGCGIIIGFAFMPLGLVMGFNKEFKTQIEVKSEIILYLSIMTGFIGYVLTILWGLFPWWTLFALLFILILIFAIKWQRPEV